MKPRLLDLFCGAGGASVGYARAGFEVSGVDIDDHPSYPFELHLEDALAVAADLDYLSNFDVVHASPPCQSFTRAGHLRVAQGKTTSATDLLTPLRPLLLDWAAATGGVYIIENVPGAPMIEPVTLCGSSFGLAVRRHRLFESNAHLTAPPCDHKTQGRPIGVYGTIGDDIPQGGSTARTIEAARAAMGIDWMQWRSTNQEWQDLKEAIPPAYTDHLGTQLLTSIVALSASHT